MVERVLCKHEVVGSNPSGSTISPKGDDAWRMEMRAVPQHCAIAGNKLTRQGAPLRGLLVVVHLTS